MATKNLIGSMPFSEKLDGNNCGLWHLKVQFILNEGDMLDHLTVSMPTPIDMNELGKDIIATKQYKQSLTAY